MSTPTSSKKTGQLVGQIILGLTVVLVVLKVCGIVTWSWLFVLIPSLVSAAVVVCVAAFYLGVFHYARWKSGGKGL